MNNLNFKNRHSVRKTITIDGDLADAIDNLVKNSKTKKEKAVVNDLLRKGLATHREAVNQPQRKLRSFASELRPGVTAADLEKLLDEI